MLPGPTPPPYPLLQLSHLNGAVDVGEGCLGRRRHGERGGGASGPSPARQCLQWPDACDCQCLAADSSEPLKTRQDLLVALDKRRRVRGKRPEQRFLPAPGSCLLPPGALQSAFQTPSPTTKRQASPQSAALDKTSQVARVEPGGGSGHRSPEQPGGKKQARAKYGTAQTFAGRRPPPRTPRRGSCSTPSGPSTTGRRSCVEHWAALAASTQSTNTTSS